MMTSFPSSNDVIIGVGNPILSDDGIGIFIAQKLRKDLKKVAVEETSYSGMNIVDCISGFKRAIIIDSIVTGKFQVGEIQFFHLEDFGKFVPFSIHSTDMVSAIETAKNYNLEIPKEIFFIGIEVKDNSTFTETFSEEIEARKESIYNQVKSHVLKILEGK